jgi:predicted 3-demethylubiquinone-9 3-methyltransferase (glyoxalase superfamily)
MASKAKAGPSSKITPFLWFNNNLEDAMRFYSSIFKDTRVSDVSRGPDGKVMTATFELEGQRFLGLNGGPGFPFTEAVSFFVDCETQDEVDELWEKLSEGGKISRCGWLQDKFGLWWQVIPTVLGRMLSDPDPQRAKRVMDSMLKMDKIEIKALEEAYTGPKIQPKARR